MSLGLVNQMSLREVSALVGHKWMWCRC